MARLRSSQVVELVEYVIDQARELVPQPLRADLKFTNRSTPAKMDVVARVGPALLFLAYTRAGKFLVAADMRPVDSFVGSLPNPRVVETLKRVIDQRIGRVADNLVLHRRLRGELNVQVHRNPNGTVRLVFEELSPEAFERILKAALPLTRSRFRREEPL